MSSQLFCWNVLLNFGVFENILQTNKTNSSTFFELILRQIYGQCICTNKRNGSDTMVIMFQICILSHFLQRKFIGAYISIFLFVQYLGYFSSAHDATAWLSQTCWHLRLYHYRVLFIHSSMALQPFVGPWPLAAFFSFVDLYTFGRTPWTREQPVARPLPTHKTA
jgi:hypothetical protein